RVQDQLRATKERNRLFAVAHRRVPDLRGTAGVRTHGLALERSLARRAEEVRLQLDRREAGPALRQRREAPVPARSVGGGADRSCVEIPVRREQLRSQRHRENDATLLDGDDVDAEQARQRPGCDGPKGLRVYLLPATDETYLATALICTVVRIPLNAGMIAPPFVTCFWTRA